jgi:hypothetical protein
VSYAARGSVAAPRQQLTLGLGLGSA